MKLFSNTVNVPHVRMYVLYVRVLLSAAHLSGALSGAHKMVSASASGAQKKIDERERERRSKNW